MIIEISEREEPQYCDYRKMARSLDGVMIRLQDGIEEDEAYQKHAAEFKKVRVPIAVSAIVTGTNMLEMAKEAAAFWERGRDLRPTFWWLIVPEKSMKEMVEGLKLYCFYLRAFGAERVGICTTDELYDELGLPSREYGGIWLKDTKFPVNGQPTMHKKCDLLQGCLPTICLGYEGVLRGEILTTKRQGAAKVFGKQNKLPRRGEQWRLLTAPKKRKGAKRK